MTQLDRDMQGPFSVLLDERHEEEPRARVLCGEELERFRERLPSGFRWASEEDRRAVKPGDLVALRVRMEIVLTGWVTTRVTHAGQLVTGTVREVIDAETGGAITIAALSESIGGVRTEQDN